MDKSELEKFFDKYIMDTSWMLGEDVKEQLAEELEDVDQDNQDSPADAGRATEKTGNGADPQPPVVPLRVQEVAVGHLTPRPVTPLQIQNVVSNVKMGCNLDLDLIAQRVWNIQYKPRSHIVLMRIRKPRTTAWISKSGSINCMGAKSEVESRVAARRYARKLQKLGFPVRFLDFKITTLTASAMVFPVNLSGLWSAHRDNCSYEPELNPWLYYTGISGVNVKIFATGGITFVGAKTKAQAHEVFDRICSMLSGFRRM